MSASPSAFKTPVVAIVGRPNVGKSSLLNALARRKIAIVQDLPGITRDRVSTPIEIPYKKGPRYAELVDTGGYGFDDSQGLTDHIREQIETAMRRADLVLFIVDAHTGIVAGDEFIADLLRKLNRKVLIIANKADGGRYDLALGDFARLGFGSAFPVSATTGRNINGLAEFVGEHLDLANAPKEPPRPDLKVAIVGKRNAGKSTLVNAIARLFEPEGTEGGGKGDDRVIVSEVPGTTRDSVDVIFEKDGRTMIVIDTAGVRKKKHMVTNDIEFYSFHRAQRSVRRADVVLLLIDATEKVSEPDKKLASYVTGELKPVVIVVNKWDLAKEKLRTQRQEGQPVPDDRELMEQYREYIDEELKGLGFAPMAFITAREGKNVPALLDLCRNLHKTANERVTTGQLNAALEEAMSQRTPGGAAGGKRRPKIYYATQVAVDPPHLVLFVNDPKLFDESYRRFLINRFRDALPFEEVPIRLTLRARNRPEEEEGIGRPTAQGARPASAGGKMRPGGSARKPVPLKGRKAAARSRAIPRRKKS